MKSWDNLKHGDKVKNVEYGEVFEIYIWRGEKYLTRDSHMWLTTYFDPKDWVKLTEENIYCMEKFIENKWETVGTFDTYDKAKTQIEFEKRHDVLFNEHNQYRIIVKE